MPAATLPTIAVGAWSGGTLVAGSIGTFTVAGSVTSVRMTILGSTAKGTALNTFTAGNVIQSDLQITSGNVNSFQCIYFINTGLFVGYRLVDPLILNDPAGNNSNPTSWEGNFTLGSFKTTAVLSAADPGATAGCQSSDIVASILGSVALSGVNAVGNIPTSVTVNGVNVAVPPLLLQCSSPPSASASATPAARPAS